MKIMLIEPPSCVTGIGTGIAFLAAVLKKAGHEVYGVSMPNHNEYEPHSLQKECVERFRPDVVGYSIYYINTNAFKSLIKDLRLYYDGATVVGGPQLNLENEVFISEVPELDYAVIGEAEETILELLDVIKGKKNPKDVDGLIFRGENKSVVRNEQRQPNRNLDELPFPDYKSFGVNKTKTYFLMTSRGCPYRCTFCNRNSEVWRPRSPQSSIDELKHAIKEYDIKDFALTDTFNIQPKRVIEFCELLLKEKLNLSWHCSGARCDRLDIDMLKIMKKSGCTGMSVGIETLQPEVFSRINKGETIEEIIQGINNAKSVGLDVDGYFIIGLLGDTPQGVMDTYNKAIELGLNSVSCSILLPFPKTKIYDELHKDKSVTWLEDYHNVTTFWAASPEWSVIKTGYETPEFSAESKIDLYHKIRTLQADPRPPFCQSRIVFAIRCINFMFKYCSVLSFFPTLFKWSGSIIRRLIDTRGRTLSKVDIHFDPNHLPKQTKKQEVHGW